MLSFLWSCKVTSSGPMECPLLYNGWPWAKHKPDIYGAMYCVCHTVSPFAHVIPESLKFSHWLSEYETWLSFPKAGAGGTTKVGQDGWKTLLLKEEHRSRPSLEKNLHPIYFLFLFSEKNCHHPWFVGWWNASQKLDYSDSMPGIHLSHASHRKIEGNKPDRLVIFLV